MAEALLQMREIVKTFPGVRALDGVDLEVRAGEVHCLLGQNGAGKSTLIKVLSGAHQPDSGSISWQGEQVRIATPMAAMRLGVATVYQELDLVDGLSVAENIFLGHELAAAGFSRRGQTEDEAAALLERLGHPEIAPSTEVGRMSAAGKQIVSMARALSHDVRLMIMDEPSAVLDQEEVGRLFRVIKSLTDSGVAVVYISHRLEEIREVGDRVTVLKDGRTVATDLPAAETPTSELIRRMTGREVEYVFPDRPGVDESAPVVVDVSGLAQRDVFAPVDFQVRKGEIVGLAGLVGSGRSEILEAIFGVRKPTAGSVAVDGKRLRPGSVRSAVSAGVGLSPEERKSQGLVLHEAIYRNVSLASLHRFARAGFVSRREERAKAAELTSGLDVRPPDIERAVGTLSGGNQQKVVLARWLLRECQVLLLDEPTRGVDVGARTELYALVRRLADSGVAIVLVSSELPEVLGLADRVLVLREGRVVHTGSADEIDEHRVLDLVMEGSAA
ncbi:MAG: sugar ABC transporter ATP-binding protein [Actinomycetota bacterium]